MPSGIVHDAPEPGRHDTIWGSDLIASVLRELDIPYIAHVPGSSYRGLHDSIVNYLGNRSRRSRSRTDTRRSPAG